MSLKDNVNYVKQELNSQEKFLEGFVKSERFWKKHKKMIITLLAIVVIGLLGYAIKVYLDSSNKQASNIAFNQFLNNYDDTQALNTLKDTSLRLYYVALYLKSKEQNINEPINDRYLGHLHAYTKAIESQDIAQLDALITQTNFLLKEFALFNKALILAQNKEYEEARQTLKVIKQDSQVTQLASLLNHYLMTK
jgi:hypothetical protein